MDIGVVSTDKPWTMLVFVLVAINAIVALSSLVGVSTPLDSFTTQPSMFIPDIEPATTLPQGVDPQALPSAATTTINGAAILLLALNMLILYGLTKGHVWSWWLLTFTALTSVIVAVIGAISGEPLSFIPFVVNVVMVAALLKKEVVQTYKPQLQILPQDGVW